jgi:hypothetical protein
LVVDMSDKIVCVCVCVCVCVFPNSLTFPGFSS